MMNMEQAKKEETIQVDQRMMIKWQISDKRHELIHVSDPVLIDGFQFVFNAERNTKKYKGLKIYTTLLPRYEQKKVVSRNIKNLYMEKFDSAPYDNFEYDR
jgi:hypothetical protein